MKKKIIIGCDKIFLFHNKRCSKSREVKKYLDENNIMNKVVDYLSKANYPILLLGGGAKGCDKYILEIV